MTRRNLYTVAEYAALTGAKRDTIRKRCQRGLLRARKYGDRWRVYARQTSR